jgi:hypothetical protein
LSSDAAPGLGKFTKMPWHEYPSDGRRLSARDTLAEPRGARAGPARTQSHYGRAAWAFSGSQMLMWWLSGMMNRQMTKHTAGTTIG